MAQLISMKQRIKAVETIKKITHAMRLTSMSTHTRLKHKKEQLTEYRNAFETLWHRVKKVLPPTSAQDIPEAEQTHLTILAAAQKGLCGTFNTSLFRFYEKASKPTGQHHMIAVGKYATDYCNRHNTTMLASYDNFTASHFVAIAQAIAQLATGPTTYHTITIYSMYQKNFFIQEPQKRVLFPTAEEPIEQETNDYIFEQSPEELRDLIHHLMLTVNLQDILFDSLLAEQAARFISMDSSTRNADNLLVSMTLEYNKLRQAAITKELTELAASF